MTTALRPELAPLPSRMTKLPVARGYPVPWFVAWVDGVPEFRAMDMAKFVSALKEKRCWVCGEPLGHYLAFTIGPMCAVNRVSSEPPSHRECALYSAQNCPFLTRPHMDRRRNNYPEEAQKPGGMMIERNPGVALVWITKSYTLIRQPGTTPLFSFGDPTSVFTFARGKAATPAEVRDSVVSGLPILADDAAKQGPRAVAALTREVATACTLLGIVPIQGDDYGYPRQP